MPNTNLDEYHEFCLKAIEDLERKLIVSMTALIFKAKYEGIHDIKKTQDFKKTDFRDVIVGV